MPRKCESCKHYVNFGGDLNGSEYCGNAKVVPYGHPWSQQGLWPLEQDEMLEIRGLESAREICDREGDGIFVYFEPKTPSAGCTFEPGPPQLAMRAAA